VEISSCKKYIIITPFLNKITPGSSGVEKKECKESKKKWLASIINTTNSANSK
jgi:hypothetical protein